MTATDLRLGNYVEHDDSWCYRGEDVTEFQWSELDWYALGESTLMIEAVKPIPLTEEWLLKFDFKFKELGFENLSVSYGLTSGDIHFVIDRYYKKLDHVHQLQNLYHALTGEELTDKFWTNFNSKLRDKIIDSKNKND